MQKLILLQTLLVALTQSLTIYGDSTSNVLVLTGKNFNKEVIESNDLWLILFSVPSNQNCIQLTAQWEGAA